MNSIQKFSFDGTAINVIDRDGGVWFVAKDVCDVLGIQNSRDAVVSLDDDEKNTVAITYGTPGNPNQTIISESGFYKLVFRSRKAVAKEFTKWVTSEVLPSIRKNGSYSLLPDLNASTARLIDKINNDLECGVEVRTAELRYCSTIARLTGIKFEYQRSVIDPDVASFAARIPLHTEMPRCEVIRMFRKEFPDSHISPRRFWPMFRRSVNIVERRSNGSRYVEVMS